jgi:hypothetical protein
VGDCVAMVCVVRFAGISFPSASAC